MRKYNLPVSLTEKEKVIGGILNINQFAWIISGIVLGLAVFIISYFVINLFVAIILGLGYGVTGFPFAFYKKNGLTLFEYLSRKRKFNKKSKRLMNIRKGGDIC